MALDLGIGIPGLFAGGNYIQGESGNILDVTEIGQMNVSGSVIFPSAQDVTIDNAYLEISGSVVFADTQNVNIASGTVGITGNPDVNIQGESIYAVQSGAYLTTVDNAFLNISGSVYFDSAQNVTIDNAVLDISGSIVFQDTQDVNITTAELDVNLSGSNITLDVFTTGANREQHKINVVSGASTTQSWTNAIKSFIFYNDGPGNVHIEFDANATTDKFKIVDGASFSVDYATQDTRFITDISGSTIYSIGLY